MAATSYTKVIDRSLLLKKIMERKYGTYDEIVVPMVEKNVSGHFPTYVCQLFWYLVYVNQYHVENYKIMFFQDKIQKQSQECGQSFSGNNDNLREALGTPKYSG